jgi:hypothetical protein
MRPRPVRKIFIGCTDIASLIHDFTIGFRAIGVDVLSMVHHRQRIQGGLCDFEIDSMAPLPPAGASADEINRAKEQRAAAIAQAWSRAVDECDTFLFIWNSFRDDYADLVELRKRGKRIVWWFMGDDSRWKTAYDQDVAQYGLAPLHYSYPITPQELLPKLLRLRTAEAIADVVVNTPSQCALAIRPYFDALHSPISLDRYPLNTSQRERPVLLHAPSNADKKGSTQILAVFEELRAEGLQFDVRLLDRVPHAEALRIYEDVDVLVGQLGAITLGKQDRELMATGKVVVGGTDGTYPQRWPGDCPNVPALTVEQLRSALRAIIPDVERRRELALRGRPFVATRHDPATTCARMIEAVEGKRQPDFAPTFFRERFLPESPEMAKVYNAGTQLVRQQPWYRKHVRPGERDGLVF